MIQSRNRHMSKSLYISAMTCADTVALLIGTFHVTLLNATYLVVGREPVMVFFSANKNVVQLGMSKRK